MNNILDSQQHQVAEIRDQLHASLEKISQDYNNELLELETDTREQNTQYKSQLEDNYSDQLLDMHGKKSDLELRVSELEDELNSTQTEYDLLKVRYDNTVRQLDQAQFENRNLNETLNRSRPVLLSPDREPCDDALSICSNDVEIASEKYVNIEYTSPTPPPVSPTAEQNLEDQLKLLRAALNEAKRDASTLKEEKENVERLSEDLKKELNGLKSQLENQSVFNVSKHFENQDVLKFLESSVHELLSRTGYNIADPDISREESGMASDSIARLDESQQSQYPPDLSVLSTTSESEDAKQLFNKIQYVFHNAKAERDVLYKQLKYLNGKFSGIFVPTSKEEDVELSEGINDIIWEEVQEELLDQSVPVSLSCGC